MAFGYGISSLGWSDFPTPAPLFVKKNGSILNSSFHNKVETPRFTVLTYLAFAVPPCGIPAIAVGCRLER